MAAVDLLDSELAQRREEGLKRGTGLGGGAEVLVVALARLVGENIDSASGIP
jgi:hypothetical protein